VWRGGTHAPSERGGAEGGVPPPRGAGGGRQSQAAEPGALREGAAKPSSQLATCTRHPVPRPAASPQIEGLVRPNPGGPAPAPVQVLPIMPQNQAQDVALMGRFIYN
jgi:hypothetical protein